MQLNEYASQVGSALREAHNSKNMAAVEKTFKSADDVLATKQLGRVERKAFWDNVRAAIFSGRLLTEKQANSSLLELMRAIEDGLRARQGS